MDDGRTLLVGDPRDQQVMDPVDHRRTGQAVHCRMVELAVPTLELAGDVPLPSGEVAEADRVDVHRVELGQRVDQGVAGVGAGRLGQCGRRLFVPHDVALDEGHHVEGRAVDRVVGAQPEGAGNRDSGGAESGDDRVLPRHVVGGGEDVADRRPAQGEGAAGGVGHPVGQVGAAPGDEVECERRFGVGDVAASQAVTAVPVDPLDRGTGRRPALHPWIRRYSARLPL